MPDKALKKLEEGNWRFSHQLMQPKDLMQQVKATANGQHPFAAVLTCIDSRVAPEIIFDLGIGDIFTIRVAGNVVNEDVLGSLEYACKVTGSKLIVVLGHTHCGAINSAIKGVEMGNITPLLSKIKPAVEEVSKSTGNKEVNESDVTVKNVKNGLEAIRSQSPILKGLELEGKIKIIGAIYNVENGEVEML